MLEKRYCALFGHRFVFDEELVQSRLYDVLEKIINSGITYFLVGTHGDFDFIAIATLKKLREKYKDIEITVVFTGVKLLGDRKKKENLLVALEGVNHTSYFVEDLHFKQRITASNEMMVDDSQIVICYYNPTCYSVGVKHVVKYANKTKKKVINIFSQEEYEKRI